MARVELDIERPRQGSAAGQKGLKAGAIGFVSNLVIGVASTAPGYSLAASLGFVIGVAGVGLQSPAIMIVAFIPMLFIAAAYYYMNRADPDCGTTFTWATRAMGPYLGWMGGWGIACSGTIVMANLAQIAGLYTFILFGIHDPSTFQVTLVGVLFIVLMTWICVIGIELSAATQVGLLAAELLTLMLFAVIALARVYGGSAGAQAIHPALSWFNPFAIDSLSALVNGVVIAVFIYWGWDSTVTVNEESSNANETPGRAAVLSTIILVLIYLIVTVAAQAYNGPAALAGKADALSGLATDVFGPGWDKIVIMAVLTSAAASCQTTILPNARTYLSMARQGAFPRSLGNVSPRYQTPHTATIVFGLLSTVWYVGLTIVSKNILLDSIAALGLMICFYYGLTGLACIVYYRRELTKSPRNFLMVGVAPAIGSLMLGYAFIKSCIDLGATDAGDSDAVFGVGAPLVIGLGFLLIGLISMAAWNLVSRPPFFRRRPEVASPGVLDGPTAANATLEA